VRAHSFFSTPPKPPPRRPGLLSSFFFFSRYRCSLVWFFFFMSDQRRPWPPDRWSDPPRLATVYCSILILGSFSCPLPPEHRHRSSYRRATDVSPDAEFITTNLGVRCSGDARRTPGRASPLSFSSSFFYPLTKTVRSSEVVFSPPPVPFHQETPPFLWLHDPVLFLLPFLPSEEKCVLFGKGVSLSASLSHQSVSRPQVPILDKGALPPPVVCFPFLS